MARNFIGYQPSVSAVLQWKIWSTYLLRWRDQRLWKLRNVSVCWGRCGPPSRAEGTLWYIWCQDGVYDSFPIFGTVLLTNCANKGPPQRPCFLGFLAAHSVYLLPNGEVVMLHCPVLTGGVRVFGSLRNFRVL